MRRRDFIAAAVAAIIPGRVAAQPAAKIFRVGMLTRGGPISDESPPGLALIRGLARRGYTLHHNLAFERRAAMGRSDLVPRLLAELVASKVDVILAISYPAALASKKGTTLPVVVYSAGDPVATGLVESLAQPGGNLTGISDVTVELSPKRLELLKEITPDLHRVAMLWNAGDPAMTARYKVSEAAAKVLGISVEPVGVRAPEDFDLAFAGMSRSKPDAIFVVADGLTLLNRERVLNFAVSNRLPAVYEEFDSIVREGGLMCYAPDVDETFDRIADLIDRILKGAKPQDLPFEQPTRFRLVINLKRAKELGLSIPQSLLLRADELIE